MGQDQLLNIEAKPDRREAEIPAPAGRTESAAVCFSAPLEAVPGRSMDRLARCPLPNAERGRLMLALRKAPHFTDLPLPRHGDARPLRLVIIAEELYYARQAAQHLCAINRAAREELDREINIDDWYLSEMLEEDEDEASASGCENQLKGALAVVSPLLLDPELDMGEFSPEIPPHAAQQKLDPAALEAEGVLVCASRGAALSDAVAEQLGRAAERGGPNLFLALLPGQTDHDLVEELRFRYGFQVCRVGVPDGEYQVQTFRAAADRQGVTLGGDVDPAQVIANLRRYRGERYEETDMGRLLRLAARQEGNRPLSRQSLMVAPVRRPEGSGWAALDRMIGLETAKSALRRQLAAFIFRARSGRSFAPVCHSLAFSGSPGTGKSVTARLTAQILRENGCGSGRFVEAGREQLIGAYTGQTSPKVAKLFEQARGGVLFIDEAGSLLDRGQDVYAAEAVTALVRHMELEPETMVIFASYPAEIEQLLSSDRGLSSRVAQVLEFPDYTPEELWQILNLQAGGDGLAVPEESREDCLDFFRRLKARKGGDFGNGREARRLYQTAVEELALRALDAPEERALAPRDLSAAAERLLGQLPAETAARGLIGFGR